MRWLFALLSLVVGSRSRRPIMEPPEATRYETVLCPACLEKDREVPMKSLIINRDRPTEQRLLNGVDYTCPACKYSENAPLRIVSPR